VVRTRRLLAENLEGHRIYQAPESHQAEGSQALGRPAAGIPSWGVGDHQMAAGTEQGCRALGGHRRRAEGSGHDEGAAPADVASTHPFCPLTKHVDTIPPTEVADGVAEEGGTQLTSVDEEPRRRRPSGGHDQSGEATSAAQVNDGPGPRWVHGRTQCQAPLDLRLDRSRAQMALQSGFLEDADQG